MIVLSLAFLAVVVKSYRSQIEAAHESASLSVNRLLQSALENAMIKRDLEGLQDIVARLGGQDGVAGVMIVHPGGEVRFSSYPGTQYNAVGDPDVAVALARQAPVTRFHTLEDGREVLRSINPVHNQTRCQLCHGPIAEHPVNGLLVVDYESDARATALSGALMLGGLGVVVLAALQVGLWLALRGRVLNRLERLRVTARALAGGALDERAQDDGEDELSELGRAFNNMAGELSGRMQELDASRSFLQSLIDAIPDGVRVIGADYRIVIANAAYHAQIGQPEGSAAGMLCYQSSHGRDKPCVPTLVRCPVAEILEGRSNGLKTRHAHRNQEGAEISVEVSAARTPMLLDGAQVDCVVESIRDLETDLAVSQEQRLAEMGLVAAGVAHEVHNPLSSIKLALRAIREQSGQDEAALRYMDIAETEISNCMEITENLLRLTSAPLKRVEPVRLAVVVRDTLALLRYEAERSDVELVIEAKDEPRVMASDSDMRFLVFNLALNALHAMPEGGRLTVSVLGDGEVARIALADTGIGIAERDREKVLQPFWTRRADGSRGRGLGLAICNSIVRDLNGSMDFESEVGVGTTFFVILPRIVEEAGEQES